MNQENQNLVELDEVQTYVGHKTNKIWIWTAINHLAPDILAMEIGDRSGLTFDKKL
jgi:insertion element IS1 protein InsB